MTAPYPHDRYRPIITRAVNNTRPHVMQVGNRHDDDIHQEATIAVWVAHAKAGHLLDDNLVYAIAARRAIDYIRREYKTRIPSERRPGPPLSIDRHRELHGGDLRDARDPIADLLTTLDYQAARDKIANPRYRVLADLITNGHPIRDAAIITGYTHNSAQQTWVAIVKRRIRDHMTVTP